MVKEVKRKVSKFTDNQLAISTGKLEFKINQLDLVCFLNGYWKGKWISIAKYEKFFTLDSNINFK